MQQNRPTANLAYTGNKITVSSPYDAGFVARLKSGTKSRRWNPAKKAWTVDIGERQELLKIAGEFYQVVEDNQPPGTGQPSLKADSSSQKARGGKPPAIKPGAELEIWADGACSTNPGPGGYGIVFKQRERRWEKSGGFRLTTNNRMEITGVLAALESLPDRCRVTVFSDSQYLVNSMTRGWAKGWETGRWIKKGGRPVPNADLWKRLLEETGRHDVAFKWVRGHDGSPENERCDEMAVAAAGKHRLPEDKGYRPGKDSEA